MRRRQIIQAQQRGVNTYPGPPANQVKADLQALADEGFRPEVAEALLLQEPEYAHLRSDQPQRRKRGRR